MRPGRTAKRIRQEKAAKRQAVHEAALKKSELQPVKPQPDAQPKE